MKLHKQIEVADQLLKLVKEEVRLSLMSPGRAVFTVQSEIPLSGIVRFSMGYDPQELQRYFVGYVESCTTLDSQQQRLFCRELSATLNRRIPLSLRNVDLKQVLAAISDQTGLRFVTPKANYTETKASAFYSLTGGYHCLDSMAEVFSIPQLIWQQQGDGQVYVGSWQHSYWSGREVEIPPAWLDGFGVANRARIPAVPKLRPGIYLSNRNYLHQVNLVDSHMLLSWSPNPWTKRLKK
ncbi:hypothetical protein [Hahella ganghwensis]|uniref:hypothetical protein n=1 Tax=Hahella ganghwensis TaxID=286420 RepID=UPI00037055A7|nr:hypothetical protein [Hahella ganghwensis]